MKIKNIILITLILTLLFFSITKFYLSYKFNDNYIGFENIWLENNKEEDLDLTNKCDKPYILSNGTCCLDQNRNKICDGIDAEKSKYDALYINFKILQIYTKDTTDYIINKNEDSITIVIQNFPSETKYLHIESIYQNKIQIIEPGNYKINMLTNKMGEIIFSPNTDIIYLEDYQINIKYGNKKKNIKFGGKISNSGTTFLY